MKKIRIMLWTRIFPALLCWAMAPCQTAFAAPVLSPKTSADLVKKVAVYMNSFRTYEEAVSYISSFLSAEEESNFRAQFRRLNFDLKTKLPKFVATGNELKFAGTLSSLKLLDDGAISFGNHVYRPRSQQELEANLRQMVDDSLSSKSTFLPSLFPSAFAAEAVPAMAAGVAAGVLSLYPVTMGVTYAANAAGAGLALGTGFWIGSMAATPLVVLGASVWIGKEVYESLRDGTVECNGKYFVLRQKTRALGVLPTHDKIIIDLPVVRSVLNDPSLTGCDRSSAESFEGAIKDATVRKRVIDSSKGDAAR